MERFKNNWKTISLAAGGAALSFLGYYLWQNMKKDEDELGSYSNDHDVLSKEEAFKRSSIIQNVRYSLFLQIKEDTMLLSKHGFEGSISITFGLSDIQNTFLNFKGDVTSMRVNGETVKPNIRNNRIYLDKSILLQTNTVLITFKNKYSNDMTGLRHFVDPDDAGEYIFSNFEPFSCHKVFPCFDQPNLKAPIKLYVSASKDWIVSANGELLNKTLTEEEAILKHKEINTLMTIPPHMKNYAYFEFAETVPIPTYVVGICAGNFVEFHDNYSENSALPKMRILSRRSVVDYVDDMAIFKIARESSKWLIENIHETFPVNKVDHVFIPGLGIDALENVGCVIYDDTLLTESTSEIEKNKFYLVLVHGLAKHFFGNYLTHEWWDDLWIKESFSTFFSYLCLHSLSQIKELELNEFEQIWTQFSINKTQAIRKDQYRSTHKLREEVENTDKVNTIYDELTAHKGSALIKYYYYLVGQENFLKAVNKFFNLYSNNVNVNYVSIMTVLNESDLDMSFSEQNESIKPYLEHAGITKLEPIIKIMDNKIVQFDIKQTPDNPSNEVFYPHQFNVLFIYDDKEEFFPNIKVEANNLTNLPVFLNKDAPKAIILNAGDWSYFKQTFEQTSLEWLLENTYKVKDPQTIIVIARDLMGMVRDGLLDPKKFVSFVLYLLKNEHNSIIVEEILRMVIYMVNNFILYSYQSELKQTLFKIINEKLFPLYPDLKDSLINFMIDLMDNNSPEEIRFILHYLKQETSNKKISLLRGNSEILDKPEVVKSFDLENLKTETKIKLLETIFESHILTLKEKFELEKVVFSIDINLSKDKLLKYTLEGCIPNKERKEILWNMFKNKDRDLLDIEYKAYMRGFARKNQYGLLREYFKEKFFDDFIYVKTNHSSNYAKIFFETLNPGFVLSERILKQFKELYKYVRKDEYVLKSLLDDTVHKLESHLKIAKKQKPKPNN